MQPLKWIGRDKELVKWLVQRSPSGYIYVEPFTDIISPLWYISKPSPVEDLGVVVSSFVARIYRQRSSKNADKKEE